MNRNEVRMADMMLRILEAEKKNPSTLMHAIILGYCVASMVTQDPEKVDPTIRDCIGSAYAKANRHVAPELGIDDFFTSMLHLGE